MSIILNRLKRTMYNSRLLYGLMTRIFIFGLVISLAGVSTVYSENIGGGSPTSPGAPSPTTVGSPSSSNSNSFTTLKNPLKTNENLGALINTALNLLLTLASIFAVLYIIYLGFEYVISRGDEKKLSELHQRFLWAAVGIGIIFSAKIIAEIIEKTIQTLK